MLAGASADAGADVRRVWAVNDGEKVERDARQHPASARNSAWDGRVVRLFGARNEIVAFQVIVEADGRVGDVWRRRYDSLKLYSPASHDELPGIRFRTRYSVAQHTAAIRSGVASVYGATCSFTWIHSGSKSTG